MVRSPSDSYAEYLQGSGAFLHPTSDSFGLVDRGTIERSVLAAGRNLLRSLLRLNRDLQSGSISSQGFALRGRAYVRAAYFIVYSLGAISLFPFYTLTDRDVEVLDAALDSQTGFLRRFGLDLARGHLLSDPVYRTGLYVLALRGIFEQGRLEAMPPGPYRWRLGPTDHCPDCLRTASGGPYQRSSYSGLGLPVLPGIPGSGELCEGLTRCGCTIEMANGVPLPNEQLAERIREVLQEVVDGDYPALD